jgi:hypothetical protein
LDESPECCADITGRKTPQSDPKKVLSDPHRVILKDFSSERFPEESSSSHLGERSE